MLKLPPIDTLSFWIGFFIASLFWLIISGLRQAVKRLISTTRERNQQRQQADIESLESILLSSVVKRAQKNHMASLLFPLDAVLITPRCLSHFQNYQVKAYLTPFYRITFHIYRISLR